MALLETFDLTKRYGKGELTVLALDRVNLTLERGEFVAIMGPSGSGKSTLMNILGCLDRPTEGRYVLDSVDVSKMNRTELAHIRNERIGFIFQSYNLLPRATALQNVAAPLLYARREDNHRQGRESIAARVLDQVGLGDRTHHRPQELSGGQQQRVAIARALVNEPALILADEPTGNLDSQSGQEILQLLQDLHRQGGTIVVVTHDLEIAAQTQRTIHLHDGRIESIVANQAGSDQRMEVDGQHESH